MTRDLPSVSVIVPIYNVEETLPITAPSWLAQGHTELLLVDDGSTDRTVEVLESLTHGYNSARIFKHESNRGRAAARNTGIAAASGDVLLFLDADMRPEPDFVRQHALLHRDAEVIGVVSQPALEGLDPSDPYHRYLASGRGVASVVPGQPLPFKYFIIGYTSVKADAVHMVGGFDERFTYGEDLDFAYRLAKQFQSGLRYSALPVVHHYDHGTLDDRLEKLREFGQGNLPLLLEKHPIIAKEANLDFVDCPHSSASPAGRLKRWSLSSRLAASARHLLPYTPTALSNKLLRYIMAHTVADAYRKALSHRQS
jgi:glycosyltransferase involved in cell wall biosynthesis